MDFTLPSNPSDDTLSGTRKPLGYFYKRGGKSPGWL